MVLILPQKIQTNRTDEKQDPPCCCSQETQLNIKDRHYLRVKGWKKIFQANGTKKQADIALLISDERDFKPNLVRREKKTLNTHQ